MSEYSPFILISDGCKYLYTGFLMGSGRSYTHSFTQSIASLPDWRGSECCCAGASRLSTELSVVTFRRSNEHILKIEIPIEGFELRLSSRVPLSRCYPGT